MTLNHPVKFCESPVLFGSDIGLDNFESILEMSEEVPNVPNVDTSNRKR